MPAAAGIADPVAAPAQGYVIPAIPATTLVTPLQFSAPSPGAPPPAVTRPAVTPPIATTLAPTAAQSADTVSVDDLLEAYGLTGGSRRRRRD